MFSNGFVRLMVRTGMTDGSRSEPLRVDGHAMLTNPVPCTLHAKYHDDGLRCRHCVFVVFLGSCSVACRNPKCSYGQAGWDTKCSAFVREIGADDDLPPVR